jgi:hypothetical protein
VNYGDGTGLLPPEAVVSALLLSKLRRTPEPAGLMRMSVEDAPGASVSSAAYEAMVLQAMDDSVLDFAVAEDAMLCGYGFARLAVGPLPRTRAVSPAEILRRVGSMDLHGLFARDAFRGRALADSVLGRRGAGHAGALEEAAVTWAWAFGLGVALVEADLDAGRSGGALTSPETRFYEAD